jgi:hypothetical protein
MSRPLTLSIENLVVETFPTNDSELFSMDDGATTDPCIKTAAMSVKYPARTCDYIFCQW